LASIKSTRRWVARTSFDGQRKAYYGRTRSDAYQELTAALKRRHDGLPQVTQRQTVGEYLEKWIAGVPSSVRGTTYRGYEHMVRKHLIPRLGKIGLAKLAPSDLMSMYAEMLAAGLAPRTAGHAHRILGRALREAEAAGIIARNVSRLVRPPRVPHKEMATLSGAQARALIHAAIGDRLHGLYAVALASGARQGELLALRWSDVDMDAGTIRITRTLVRGIRVGVRSVNGVPQTESTFNEPKTASSRRTIPIGRTAIDVLRVHRKAQAEERLRAGPAWDDGNLVFPSAVGTPLDASNLRIDHHKLLRSAGLPRIRWHDLRHTAATLLLEAGVHPRAVADRLGHATPSLVMNTYGHVTERMQREATTAMDTILGGSAAS
jgi:integrase